MGDKTRVVIYDMVSTSLEDGDNHIKVLRDFAKKSSYNIVREFKKKIAVTKRAEYVIALRELMDFIKENGIDKVIIYNCTRLAQPADFLNTVKELNELGVSLYIFKNSLETLLPDGSVNPTLKVVLEILSDFDMQNKQQIKARLHNAYQTYLHEGGRVGRKIGFKKTVMQYRKDYARELNLLREGLSLKKCRDITGTSINTLRKLKSMFL